MRDCYRAYKKALEKELSCDRRTKKRLMAAFVCKLEGFREETDAPTMEQLTTAFGTPKQMAQVLLEEVPVAEQLLFQQRKRKQKIGIYVCIAALFLTMVALIVHLAMFRASPIYIVEEDFWHTQPVEE